MERFFYHGPLAKDIRESRKTPWSGWLRTEWNEERHHGVVGQGQNEMKKDTMEWLAKDRIERRKTPPGQNQNEERHMDRWLRTDRNEERYHQDRMERRTIS